jgi:hypothetical protein
LVSFCFACLCLALVAPSAVASKQVVGFFGSEGIGTLGGEFSEAKGVAVNEDGTGPAEAGEIYVLDAPNDRIERFARHDNGTPPNPADDDYEFISAWGAGVESGSSEYEICTVASQCRAGGAASGNGALGNTANIFGNEERGATGIAVDQDTGNVYVTDAANFRINVYSGDGTFLRSFGYNVIASGPNKITGPNERQQLLVRASAGKFSLLFEGEPTGPWGTGGRQKGSKIVEQAIAKEGAFAVGQSISGWGIRPGTTITAVEPGVIKLSQAATESTGSGTSMSVESLPLAASAAEVESALDALSSIGGAGGSVSVSRSELSPTEFQYEIEFGGSLAHEDLPPLKTTSAVLDNGWSGLTGPTMITLHGAEGGSFTLAVGNNVSAPIVFDATAAAVQSALEALSNVGGGNVTVGGPAGGPFKVQFAASLPGLSIGAGGENTSGLTGTSPSISIEGPASISSLVNGGAYEVCVPAAGDICKAGRGGPGVGELGEGESVFSVETAKDIAISQPDGNPANGTVFVADPGNRRIDTFSLDGSTPAALGETVFGPSTRANPEHIAVDSRGIVYASNTVLVPRRSRFKEPSTISARQEIRIERYDTQNANGDGVGFLSPVLSFLGESQLITVDAAAGSYRLSSGGSATKDIPFDAKDFTVEKELEGLLSSGTLHVTCREVAEGVRAFECFAQKGATLQLACEEGSQPLSGGAGCSVETTTEGHDGPAVDGPLLVDPDPDGAGPETDVLYAYGESTIIQFGPLNQPGLSSSPSDIDDEHGGAFNSGKGLGTVTGIAVDGSDGAIYAAFTNGNPAEPKGVYVLGQEGEAPVVGCESLGEATATALTAHCSVEPRGAPLASYRLEYRKAGESSWQGGPEGQLEGTEGKLQLSPLLEPPGGGLEPNTGYEARLTVTKGTLEPVSSNVVSASTLAAAPAVETVGSPIRSATTALLSGRIDPNGSASTYRFQYGDEGPCDANPCQESDAQSVGSGQETEFVAQRLEGLEPDATYHYRLVGENTASGGSGYGEDMTVVTRDSDGPLSHGHLPGPPGSDRAYEQVNMADTGGNPIWGAMGFAADGDRALFRIAGGTPDSNTGSLFAIFYSERTSAGWQVKQITPPREQQLGANWEYTVGSADLSALTSVNTEYTKGEAAIWSLDPPTGPVKLYQRSGLVTFVGPIGVSADGSRAVVVLKGPADPAYPGVSGRELYEVDSGSTPRLLSLLPEGTPCPAAEPPIPPQESGWVTDSQVFFSCQGQVYARETATAETRLVSGPPVSGPSCGATFLKSTPRGDFFWTSSRLVGDDSAPSGGCDSSGGDIYRYDSSDHSLECSTCSLPDGEEADVAGGSREQDRIEGTAIAPDGSRLYFQSGARLLPGAAKAGGTYRLTLPSHALAYVAAGTGSLTGSGAAITPDGSALLFRSADPRLDQIGGQHNGGSAQYYLYEDEDRALSCASCPQDGSAPVGESRVGPSVLAPGFEGPNQAPLSDDGRVLAFATPTPMVGADQNTAPTGGEAKEGQDVYEWRDGRLLLITDGLTNWPKGSEPSVGAVSASGDDVFFLAPAQYTPDALDGYTRLYDARIGGGFEFPKPPPPCPLEVCRGTPKGAPEEQQAGSTNFVGPGNVAPKAHKKHKHRKHHAKKHQSKNKHSHRAAKPHGRSHR